MDTRGNAWIVHLGEDSSLNVNWVGGKAASLAKLIHAGLPVPAGFCLTVFAYENFLTQSGLTTVLQMELGRKPLNKMRWEEIWDTALRIRSAFLRTPVPAELAQAVYDALLDLQTQRALAIRSSAPGEDSAKRSFAGLHESIVNVKNKESVIRAIRTVWASLWSDAALLYRKELNLDPLRSRMAVIVQEMVPADISGVAFGRDPRNQTLDREIVEAVPGPCSNLVDGLLEPDRWVLQHSSGEIMEWTPGNRNNGQQALPLLSDNELLLLHKKLVKVEESLGCPPDMEWAELDNSLLVLQARPITSGESAADSDKRQWYLTLRPKLPKLRRMAEKVSKELIPQLERLGNELSEENIERLDHDQLAHCLEERYSKLVHWREIYKKEFIPLAHGVRYLGAYYNDMLQPEDPYEFMSLLKGQNFLASHRNDALQKLAHFVHSNPPLRKKLNEANLNFSDNSSVSWPTFRETLTAIQGGADFIDKLEHFLSNHMDTSYNGERLLDRPDVLFNLICQIATLAEKKPEKMRQDEINIVMTLQQRLLEAAGESQEKEAKEIIFIGQLSWRLRDDDNILLGRVESQFLRALRLSATRLRTEGRLTGEKPKESSLSLIIQALRNRQSSPIHIVKDESVSPPPRSRTHEKPRQLIGQPASPGLSEGLACIVNSVEDFQRFQQGNILVCKSIQPTMTHLVPIASAIVEERGGMLIHGAIIARELGIPCVNGISQATEVINHGDQLTVDGHLGIVSLGTPEFELEDQTFTKQN